jgi:aspartate-semialdehyde dehydrogenase
VFERRAMDPIKTVIVGATGVVGQQFVLALNDHPWFTISCLAASKRSSGKIYSEALKDEETGSLRWFCDEPPPESVLDMVVEDVDNLNFSDVDLVFSAVGSKVARQLEGMIAEKKPVISTARSYRYDKDVPILVPGVNFGHAKLIDVQRKTRGWKGFVVTQPNCTAIGLVYSLKPLLDCFGLERVLMTSLQAISGAGRSPGVIALDILENVIPYIPGEEEAVETETLKILGRYQLGTITPAEFHVSSTCTRVNVRDGHTESIFVSTSKPCTVEEVTEAMRTFDGGLSDLSLPSAPKHLVVVRDNPYRPQPRLDRNTEGGMATVVGRIRNDTALSNGVKYVLLSHNTKMGAAKGAVLVAEYLVKEDYI